MDSFTNIWNLILVWPIEGALKGLAEFTDNAGLAIILFTIIVRTAMLPLSLQQIKSQKAMMQLQPRLRELQKHYAGDRGKMGQEQIRLYKEAGVNPLAGCLPMLIQMPIWFALYSSLVNLSSDPNYHRFQTPFLWIPNLAMPSMPVFDDPGTWGLLILPVLTSITQWIVQKMSTMPTTDQQQQQMNRMMEWMPFMFLIFSFQVAAGLTLYWVISNVYSIFQQRFTVGWGSLPYFGTSTAPESLSGSGARSTVSPSDESKSSSPRESRPSPTRRRSSNRKRRR